MNATRPILPTPQAADVAKALWGMAQLLQALEASPHGVHPEQYRQVVLRVEHLLTQAQDAQLPALDEVLRRFPAVAPLYENLNYAQAGLCRTPVDRAVQAEIATQEVLRRVRSGPQPAR